MKAFKLFAAMFMALSSMVFVSCGGDDEEGGDGLQGWYICKNSVCEASDFDELNTAINNNEILYKSKYNTYYATPDLFFDEDGQFDCSDHKHGRFRFAIDDQAHVIRIISNTTLVEYYAWLYDDNASGARDLETVYQIYAGPIFGYMKYCDEGRTYTYTRVEDKLYVYSADEVRAIYTIMDDGLLEDGSSYSNIMTKYDPSNIY